MKTGKSKKTFAKSSFMVPLLGNREHPFFGFCYGTGECESFRADNGQ